MPRKKRKSDAPEDSPEGLAGQEAGPFKANDYEEADPGPQGNLDGTLDGNLAANLDGDLSGDLDEPTGSEAPDNLNPNTKQRAREGRMVAEGEARSFRFSMRRLTPEKIMHENQQLLCQGQRKVIDGCYSREEIEILAADYFGGGRINVTVHDLDSGKLKTRYFLQFPGLPNIANVITDCYGGDIGTAAKIGGGGIGLIPGLPGSRPAESVTDEDRRLRELENRRLELRKQREIKQSERELAEEERLAQIEERERRKREREEADAEQREADRRSFQEEGYALGPGAAVAMNLHRRPGMLVRHGYPPVDPNDPDRALTPRELDERFERERETDRLRNEIQQLKDLIQRGANEPRSGMAETIATMMTSMMTAMQQSTSQIISAMVNANKRPEGENERWMTLFKLMADSNKSDKTVDMIVRAAGLQEDRKGNEIANLLKVLELGTQLGRDGGASADGEWWESPLRGIGDVLSAAATRLGVGQPGGPQVMLRPGPSAAVPVPGQVQPQLPVRQQQALPPPVAAAAAAAAKAAQVPQPGKMTGTPVVRLPGQVADEARVAAIEQEDASVTPEQEFRDTINMIVEEILKQARTKPARPDWVDAAYESLPFETLKVIAASDNYNVLIEQFKPYVEMQLGAALLTAIKHDSNMVPWMVSGYEQLRELAREQIEEYAQHAVENPVEPEPAAPEAPPAAAVPAPLTPAPEAPVGEEAEAVAEEGVEGGKADARK